MLLTLLQCHIFMYNSIYNDFNGTGPYWVTKLYVWFPSFLANVQYFIYQIYFLLPYLTFCFYMEPARYYY